MLKLWFSIVMSFLGHECTLALVRGLLRWSFASFNGTLSSRIIVCASFMGPHGYDLMESIFSTKYYVGRWFKSFSKGPDFPGKS